MLYIYIYFFYDVSGIIVGYYFNQKMIDILKVIILFKSGIITPDLFH